jgi:very-short-patch-repair endonuclease
MVWSEPHAWPLPTRGRRVDGNSFPSPLWGGARGGGWTMPNHLARSLRSNATPAERALWQQLRLLKSEGRHFRRQVPIAGFVADFACHYPKLVVELDGGQHGQDLASERDERRSAALAAHGYKVLRFWNSEVFEALEGVVDMIRHEAKLPTVFQHAGATPTPSPSPQGGGEQY